MEAKVAWVVLHFSGKVTLSIHVTRCHKMSQVLVFIFVGRVLIHLESAATFEDRTARPKKGLQVDIVRLVPAQVQLQPIST